MATHDPIARRYVPDPKLVHMAHNLLLEEERDDPGHAFIRQQWDAAFGATRVGMDALREIWPSEARRVDPDTMKRLADALEALEEAYHCLDAIAEDMVGAIMVAIQEGRIRTEEEFNAIAHGDDDKPSE